MADQLWDPVDESKWMSVPIITGRLAGEKDVSEGRAVFHLDNPESIAAKSVDMKLPRLASLINEENDTRTTVIVIQAEEAEGKCYIGYRFFDGGNGVCMLDELELLN